MLRNQQTGDLFDSAIRTWQALPPEDPAAIARIVATARAQRGAAGLIPAQPRASSRRSQFFQRWGKGLAASIAAAAVFSVGFVAGDSGRTREAPSAPAVSVETDANVSAVSQFVSNADITRPAVPVPTLFRLQAASAKEVAIVGDFNAWDPSAFPLVRSAADGVWRGTMPLYPGRHTYAFLIDGQVVPDPNAVNIRDPDYGVLVSTIVVKEIE